MSDTDDGQRQESRLAFEFELFRYDPLEWLVLTGDRVVVGLLAFLLLIALLAGFVASGLVPLRAETPILFLLFALIAANFTLIAIVTSLSQLVLGRRLESPDEIRRKMHETISYREEVGQTTGRRVTPVRPDMFLLALYETASVELEVLEAVQLEGRTKAAREDLQTLIDDLQAHTEYVTGVLRSPSSDVKHALFVLLSTDFENAIHRAWHLQWERGEEFTEEAAEPLADLAGTLQHIEVASRLFKTVFIESEVAELSRYLLYVGFPVQLSAVGLTLIYTTSASPPVSIPVLRVLVPGVIAAGFAPFLLLGSYVVRLTVVAGRTADTFPFSSQLSGDITAPEESWK